MKPQLLLLLLIFPFLNGANHFTVPESAPIGHIIGYIAGKPEESSTVPRYFVVFPDEQTSKFLKVDEKSGEISTISTLDYEKRSRFEIVAVKVDDNGETIDVLVEVDDENDNSPKFLQDLVKIDISEFAQLGTTFSLPSVTDGDGPNFDVHKFSILQGNVNNVFKISTRRVNEQLQADLVVNGQLDREFRDKYELVIEAQDGGKPSRTGQLRVQIQILDANDNAPVFTRSRYTASVSANISIDSHIITVSASDADIGENSRISYDIKKTASPSSSSFAISQTGVIRTTGHLLPGSTHDVIVVATDNGTPSLSSTAVITITVIGSSLSAPPLDIIWLVESNSAHLLENQTLGSIVARVSISEEYRDLKLKLMGCSALCPQQTDTAHVYLLLLCGILDRETTSEYNLRFLLQRNEKTVVEHPQLLTIGDINDNWPQWHSSQVHISLNRTQGGSRTLTAKDPDLGQNGWIRYSILDTELVSIDKETGRIFVPKAIDCHIGPEIKFRIRAEDGGSPPLSSDLHVTADLIDAKSKPPDFEKALWQVEIPEDTPAGTCLVKVVANNTQCGSSKRIRYSMQEKDEYLSVDSISGTVCVQKVFDYERMKSYRTTVVATNSNAETATSLVSIQLRDVNDNWPIFYPNEYQLTIREGPKSIEPLLVVSASDADEQKFGDVTYQILSDSSSFSINSITGEIFAMKDLSQGRYHLIVSAKDGGGQTAENPANVHITVIDSITKTPEFSQSKYEILTSEDILPGIAIGSVAAISEGKISYSIYSGDPEHHFSIDEDTGKIYVTRYLDADVHDTVLLNVQAKMNGGNSNQTQVLIHIEDHNDNAPIFPESLVEITVREDVQINEPFYVVHASDKDKKKNGNVKYSIVSSHPSSSIHVDPLTGQISTTSNFDYEGVRDFKIRIKASDYGIPSKSSNMTLFVHISDMNDNSPIFEKTSYQMEVVENSPPKTIIGKVAANDVDSGDNGQIGYRITNGSEYFGIDEKLGTIYTKRLLDREVITKVDVSVVAEDKGTPSRTSNVNVRVNILDVNDNPPSCHSITPIVVPENATPSTSIGTIVANDPDKGLNGSVLYRSQLQNSLFVIKANGDVYLRRQLNSSEETHQRLSVIVSDQGTPRKSAVCHVPIRVSKGTSNIEIHQPIRRIIPLPTNCNQTCRIIRINATGVHSWQIQSSDVSNHFSLRDGLLSLISRPMHRPPYTLVIVLSDNQGRQTSLQLRIISAGEEINREEVIQLKDTTGIGSKIGRLGERATDSTFFYRKSLSPNITSDCPLELDQTAGILYLADELRTDKNLSCFFERFNTTDGSINEMRIDLDVEKSKNDKPIFEKQQIVIKVLENTTIGSVIGTVRAESSDFSGTPISYRFTTLIDSFAIDQFTGDVTLIENLHWHLKSSHLLVVEAFTIGISTTQLINIEVEDVNDHKPKIISEPLILIPGSCRKGTIIHRMIALDEDQDSKTRFEFKIKTDNFKMNATSGEITILNSEPTENFLLVRVIDIDDETKIDEQKIEILKLNSSKKLWHYFDEQKTRIEIGARSTIAASYKSDGGAARLRMIPSSNYFEVEGFHIILKSNNVPEGKYIFTVVAESDDNFDWTILEIQIVPSIREAPKISSTSCGVVSVEENRVFDRFKRIMAVGSTENTTFRFQGKPERFIIDSITGEISVNSLDREVSQEHLLVVILNDNERNDSCTVRVSVMDVNDNKPIFDSQTPSQLVINQTTNIGDVLFRFSASDMDIGLNGKFSFEIVEDESKSLDIVPETGALVLRRTSKITKWTVIIRVFDHGTPSLSSEHKLEIENNLKTSPENIEAISFMKQSYVSSIDESMPRGQFIAKVEISEDVGITYSIVEGNIDSAFSIDSDGVVRTNVELDKEIIERYNLKVIGITKEIGQISTRIDVHVNNLNDNVPSFPNMKPRKISEGLKPGSYVATVQARDIDQLTPIEYYLTNKQDIFHLDRYTGVIHLLSSLDYEIEKEHVLKIKATDGQFETSANLTISLSDLNDNAPIFAQSFYRMQVSPSSYSPDVPFAKIEATDLDSGANSKISYSVENESDLFRINSEGSLFLKVLPPSGEQYLVTVTAVDGGIPSLSTSVPVSITVGDIDDNEDVIFESLHRQFEIAENSLIGMLIGNLSSNLKEFSYRIVDPEASKSFSIDRFGRVFVAKNIDREQKQNYSFEVEAQNESSLRQTKCQLFITILDQNDNTPTFGNNIVNVGLRGTMNHGQAIASISATDPDSNENGRISYRILTGNDYNIFSMNPDTGALIFNEWNDAQLKEFPDASWKMLVEARDHGIPYRSSIATVIVSLKMSSWSGSAPFFVIPTYDIHILEDTPINSIIQSVRASNRYGLQLNGLFYSLKESQGKFSIDVKTGEIRLKTHLDWESEQYYSMYLSVSDGNGRSAVVPLKIVVEPVDEFPPVFTKSSYTFKVPISTPVNEIIGQVEAIDEDGGAHNIVKYSIIDQQSTIKIEENSGIIRLAKSLNGRKNLTIEQVTISAFSGPMRVSKATLYFEIGPFTKETSLPNLLNYRSVQLSIVSFLFLIIVLIVLICVCMCRSRNDKTSSPINKPMPIQPQKIPKKHVYSVQTGEIRTLTGDLALSNPSTMQKRHFHDKASSLTSTVSTSSDALKIIHGSSRSQMDSGIDPDTVSVNSSVTDYLVSLGVNANPIPPRIRMNTTYDSLMNDYIYARVEDVLPPGPVNLSANYQHSLLRQSPSTHSVSRHNKPPQVLSFEPLTEIFSEIVEMKRAEEEQRSKHSSNASRKEYVQVEI